MTAEGEAAIADILHRARDYPYRAPDHSYCYTFQGIRKFDLVPLDGRTPVLAIGSNRAPERLRQKFGDDIRHIIPVQKLNLKHFDVVYSAHITNYGAVPAMLQVSPGTVAGIWVTWLDAEQLRIMNESEVTAANYVPGHLTGLAGYPDNAGRVLREGRAYIGTRGHLVHEGMALALAAVPASGRRFPEATTQEALEIVRRRAAPEMGGDAFVLRLVREPDFRDQVTARISENAVAMAYPYRVVDDSGESGDP